MGYKPEQIPEIIESVRSRPNRFSDFLSATTELFGYKTEHILSRGRSYNLDLLDPANRIYLRSYTSYKPDDPIFKYFANLMLFHEDGGVIEEVSILRRHGMPMVEVRGLYDLPLADIKSRSPIRFFKSVVLIPNEGEKRLVRRGKREHVIHSLYHPRNTARDLGEPLAELSTYVWTLIQSYLTGE